MDTNLKGRDSYASKRGTLSSEQMVLLLLESYENNGDVVYMKIFYSSPNLYLQLQKKVVGGCVTILAWQLESKCPKTCCQGNFL